MQLSNKYMNTKIAVIDLFCGAGGTTTGIERAKLFGKKVAKVIGCVDHDPIAIKSHRTNHKGVLHFTEDIRTLNLSRLIKLTEQYRSKGYIIVLWASLECTNFSNAKGGQPRDADSRTLAEHLYRYIDSLNPSYIMIENVIEFMSWGPLDNNGKPVSKDKGKDYVKWINKIKRYGYGHDWRKLNSADFGAYTSRSRYFGIFAKYGLPIIFPEPTHSKNPTNNLFASGLKKWKAVKEVLDLKDEGASIFNRKKPLSTKTMARIYAGLIKYVANKNDFFITQRNGGNPNSRSISINQPSRTITCTGGNQSLVKANFLTKYHGNGENVLSVNGPASSLTTKDRLAKINVTQFIDKAYSSDGNPEGQNSSIESPAGTLTTVNKQGLITAKPFLMATHFNNTAHSIENPAPVITANRKHNYLVNPSWFGHPTGINNPCPVIIARQDKSPLYLMTAICGEFNIPVYDEDCENTIKVKEFMAHYGIVDIKMRMLKISELLVIQGFPKTYKLAGNQSQQKKFIGNSVVPIIPEKWFKSLALIIKEAA